MLPSLSIVSVPCFAIVIWPVPACTKEHANPALKASVDCCGSVTVIALDEVNRMVDPSSLAVSVSDVPVTVRGSMPFIAPPVKAASSERTSINQEQ